MKTSQDGIAKIKMREGLELAAYPDPATGGAPWTIGYGHTGPDVKPAQRINEQTAEMLLIADLAKFEQGVAQAATVPLSQNQVDALVSFAYNVGLGNLKSSTLLRKLNAKDYQGAADEFLRWNRAAGKIMAGLVTRRAGERAQFLSK